MPDEDYKLIGTVNAEDGKIGVERGTLPYILTQGADVIQLCRRDLNQILEIIKCDELASRDQIDAMLQSIKRQAGETMMRCKCTQHEIGDGPIECGDLIHTGDFCGGRHAYKIMLRDRKIAELEGKVAELSERYAVLDELTVETRDVLRDLRTLLIEKGSSWTASSDDPSSP